MYKKYNDTKIIYRKLAHQCEIHDPKRPERQTMASDERNNLEPTVPRSFLDLNTNDPASGGRAR